MLLLEKNANLWPSLPSRSLVSVFCPSVLRRRWSLSRYRFRRSLVNASDKNTVERDTANVRFNAAPFFLFLREQQSRSRAFSFTRLNAESWPRRITNSSYDRRESKRSRRCNKNSYVFSSMYRSACLASSTSTLRFSSQLYPLIAERPMYTSSNKFLDERVHLRETMPLVV